MNERFYYLAFGSNLHPVRLTERLGPVRGLGPVELPGWRLCFDKRGSDGSAKANLRAAPGSTASAWGAVFELERAQFPLLDRFEGCGRGYDTFELDLPVAGRTRTVLTYLVPSHWLARGALPHDWYRDLVVAGARFQGFPAGVIEAIPATPARPEPDRVRPRQHAELLERLG